MKMSKIIDSLSEKVTKYFTCSSSKLFEDFISLSKFQIYLAGEAMRGLD